MEYICMYVCIYNYQRTHFKCIKILCKGERGVEHRDKAVEKQNEIC